MKKTQLIARCGMNCGICMGYLREKNRCPGCRAPDGGKAVSVTRCRIKACDRSKTRFCYACEDYPCGRIRHLDNRYRTKYHMSMVENLENIRNIGVQKFAANEKKRWACSACGGTVCVHRGRCSSCGKERMGADRLHQ